MNDFGVTVVLVDVYGNDIANLPAIINVMETAMLM